VVPTTIDGVINRLQDIIDESIKTESRLGYFAALYKRMTMSVHDGIKAGRFQDAARMEALDVAFANRYLVTRDQYLAGELHGQCWLQAYEAATKDTYTLLQHLLIGINPHIMIDLGVAAARTCPGDQLAGLQQDFNTINAVITSLFPVINAELDDLSPTESFIDHHFGWIKDKAIDAGIDEGRKSSWGFANQLASLDLPAQAIVIGKRDRESRLLGDCILHDPLATLVRKRESRDVRHNIEILDAAAAKAAGHTATAAVQTQQTSSPPR
jgi:hypothetical protein